MNSRKRLHFLSLLRNEQGLTLIEILISAVMFAFVLLAFGYIFAIGQGILGGETDRRMALTLAQEALELRVSQAGTTSGFANVEAAVGTNTEDPIAANTTPYFTASAYSSHKRITKIEYVEDSDYDDNTPASPPTNSLRVTITVSPSDAVDTPVEFSPVSLVTVVTRP